MKKIFIIISILFFLGSQKVLAAPSISNVSGAVEHGQNITISGENFGTKNVSAPALWDTGENHAINNPAEVTTVANEIGSWNEALPTLAEDSDANMQYRSIPFRNMSGPHARSSKYLVGGHAEVTTACSDSYHKGGNVAVTTELTNDPDTVYASWYERVDDLFPAYDPDGLANYKWCAVTDGGMYLGNPSCHFYFNDANNKTPQYHLSYETYSDYPYPGISSEYRLWKENMIQTSPSLEQNPDSVYGHWVKKEVLFYRGHDSNGWYKAYANNKAGWDRYRKDEWPATPVSTTQAWWDDRVMQYIGCEARNQIGGFAVGGYWRDKVLLPPVSGCNEGSTFAKGDPNAWRYIDDVYIDTTLQRIVLTNNSSYDDSTIIEPQIPSVWTGDSVAVKVNLGNLPDTGTAYLFVFDADNNHNATGYEVTLNGEPDVTAPSAPTGLSVS